MGPFILGIVMLLLAWLLPMPYVLWIILTVVGAVLVIYGLFVLFRGATAGRPGHTNHVRWW